ncbi:MAG: chorismate synthase [Alphaproteobacteria bacterium]|nr:chorismate synthase [Alphaproteobacteria bacterium]
MSDNAFGRMFRVTTWGESHGPAIGCVIDGCPPRIPIDIRHIQGALDRRRPGTSRFVTQRREPDEVRILSGVFEDDSITARFGLPVSTGAPIALMIENVDQRSKDYGDIRDRYRPGHADFAYDRKYGVRDYRGGGRSSARETALRVAAGSIAEQALAVISPGIEIRACMIGMGRHEIDRTRFDWSVVDNNPFWAPDPVAAKEWEKILDDVRKAGSSLGATIEVEATGAPAGLGEPVYGKFDADLAAALMSINAVKGVEIGAGFEAARLTGEENADEIRMQNGEPSFQSNNAGGVLGGITTGQPIVARFAVKPTSSILTPRRTVSNAGEDVEISTRGRHDPCVGIRAVPVGRAMMACVILDHVLRHRGQCG